MPISAYRQITDEIVTGIQSGQYPPGAMLPTPGDLACRGYHLGAARDALRWLARQGWAELRLGTGYHVVQQLPGHLMQDASEPGEGKEREMADGSLGS